jgi:hypothetical protein
MFEGWWPRNRTAARLFRTPLLTVLNDLQIAEDCLTTSKSR